MRLYAFGTRRSRLPGRPVSRRYRVGAHYPVRTRYFAPVSIRTAAGPIYPGRSSSSTGSSNFLRDNPGTGVPGYR
eukprot:2409803-Rhodomonas_salina.1